jgi:general secretion pathway protein H
MKAEGRRRVNSSFISHCSSFCKGFTLIEIIIVMLIIGLASGLVGIMISRGSGSRDLMIFAKDASSVLRYARNRAVTEKKIYCFVIDIEEQTYRLYSEDADYKNVQPVMERPIPEALQMSLQDSEEESPHIEFLPRGNSTGGIIEIINEKGKTIFIKINRITGKVNVLEDE